MSLLSLFDRSLADERLRRNMEESGNLFHYFTQGVAATEVEIDTLTGDQFVL